MSVPAGGPESRSSDFGAIPREPGRICARDPPWGRRGEIPSERLVGGPDRHRARLGVHIFDFQFVISSVKGPKYSKFDKLPLKVKPWSPPLFSSHSFNELYTFYMVLNELKRYA